MNLIKCCKDMNVRVVRRGLVAVVMALCAWRVLGGACLDVVRDGGADNTGTNEATKAIQSCLDRVAKAGGGTVRVPPGTYRVSSLSLGHNTRVELAGGAVKATDGYAVAQAAAADPKTSAIIRPTGNGYCGIFFYNVVPQDWTTNGTSRLTISGGVFECESRAKILAFACAKGVRVENAIVKDLPDHALQLDGCTDVVVTNCLFAGYRFEPGLRSLTGETIQIEATSAGAIWNRNKKKSPILCPKGDKRPNSRVRVAGCWFGPSENNGSHICPIGHHAKARACNGLVICGNRFVDPWYCGVRVANWTDVTIADNDFEITKPFANLQKDSALVSVVGRSALRPGERGVTLKGNRYHMPEGSRYPRLFISPERAGEVKDLQSFEAENGGRRAAER